MSLLDLLMADKVTEFNDSRGERARVELFAADLAERKLAGVDLSGADVDKADLTGTDLTDAVLYKAKFNGIDGTGMKLIDVQAQRMQLREAWLEDADLSGGDFAQADFSEATLTRTVAGSASFVGARLKAADLTDAKWPDCDLSTARLSKTNLTNADLSRAQLVEAVGGELIAPGVRFDAAVGSQARLPGANFQGASFKGAKFDGANLADCDFTGADLTGADFRGANLANAILTDAVLLNCVFAEASLEGVDLVGKDLTGVDFTGLDADLLGLSEEQRDGILAIGIPVNPDAQIQPTKVIASRQGELIVGVWENDDGESMTTLRYFARVEQGKVVHGIIPVLAESVLVRNTIPVAQGVAIVMLREKPAGVTLDTFIIGPKGRLLGNTSYALGYQPLVAPVLVQHKDHFRVFGLARSGPTLVISGRSTNEAGEPVFGALMSKAYPTARGFLGRHRPFLLCKGEVLVPCNESGPTKPCRSPAGFPGKFPNTVFDGERWMAVWVEPPAGKEPGGIRGSWLETRGAPEVLELTQNGAVLSMDVAPSKGRVLVAWISMAALGETLVNLMVVGESKVKKLPIDDVDQVAFILGPDDEIALMLTTDGVRVRLVDLEGRKLGELSD